MPAPKNPNIANANAARLVIGDTKAANRLRARQGWIVLSPDDRDKLLAALDEALLHRQRHGCPHADGGCCGECLAAAAVKAIEQVAADSPHYR